MNGLWSFSHSAYIYSQSSLVLSFSRSFWHLLGSIEKSKSVILGRKWLEKKESKLGSNLKSPGSKACPMSCRSYTPLLYFLPLSYLGSGSPVCVFLFGVFFCTANTRILQFLQIHGSQALVVGLIFKNLASYRRAKKKGNILKGLSPTQAIWKPLVLWTAQASELVRLGFQCSSLSQLSHLSKACFPPSLKWR